MNSVKTVKKEDFFFSSSVGKWLFQKIKFSLLVLFFVSFFYCYFSALIRFNIRTNFNQKNPGHGEFNWFFGRKNLNPTQNSQWYLQLLLILLLSFLLGVLVLDVICRFLQDYCKNLSKNWLKKLVIYRCLHSSPKMLKNHQEKINNVIFYNVSSLSFYFINIPAKFFENLVKISFEFYFLYFFLSSEIEEKLKTLTLGFNLIIILTFLCYTLLNAELQKKIKWEKLQRSQVERQKTQLFLTSLTWQDDNLRENKEKRTRVAKIFQLFDRNLKKNRPYFFQKIIFDLSTLITPGLNVIFYFFYYRCSAPNFADASIVYFLSLSIQSIFWKLRQILQQISDYHKVRVYYKEFNSLIKLLN